MVTLPKLETLPITQQKLILSFRKLQKPNPKEPKNQTCFICHTEKNLMRHHVSYNPLMVISVCTVCHSLIHDRVIGWHNTNQEFRFSKRYYAYLKGQPIEQLKRMVANTAFCAYGKCKECSINCYNRRLKLEWIKDDIAKKRGDK
jgi:hypothetical protein